MRYHGNKICLDERTNGETDGQPENTTPSTTMSGGEAIKMGKHEKVQRILE